MNKKFKFLTVLLALVMTLSAFAPFGAVKAADETTETVTLHKILLTKEALEKHDKDKKYDGKAIDIKEFFGDTTAKDIGGVYFAWAKKDTDGKYYWIKSDGGFIEPKKEVNENELDKLPTDTFGGETVEDSGIKFTTNTFKGEYKIYEIHAKSTYFNNSNAEDKKGNVLTDMKAVPVKITLPLVNNDGVVKEAHVYPKNTEDKPEIDKNFAKDNDLKEEDAGETGSKVGAVYKNYQKKKATVSADIGKKVPFEVKTKLPKDAKYKTLRWSDRMTPGLTFDRASFTITGLPSGIIENTDYVIKHNDRGFDLVFNETGLKKLEEALKNDSIEVTLNYNGVVNKDALIDVPEKNDIKLFYGNNKSFENEPTEVKPKDKKIKVKKSWDVTGDDTVTEADKTAKVTYILQKRDEKTNEWIEVKRVEKEYVESNPQTSFNHTFEELDDEVTYRVVEEVSGYEPEYLITNEDGTVSIKNHKKTDNPKPLNPTEPKVITGGKRFVKTNNENKDSTELKRLAGAEFYVKNAEGKYLVADQKDATKVTTARDLYIKLIADYNDAIEKATGNTVEEKENSVTVKNPLYKNATDTPNEKENLVGKTEISKKIDDLRLAYEKAFKENANAYKWEAAPEKGKPDNRVVLTSDAEGRFEITGLEYGSYKLEEKTPPKGFAKLSGDVDFVVEKGSYNGSNSDKELDYKLKVEEGEEAKTVYGLQVKNKKVSIPQTGGIGTVIFTVVGVMLMVGAAFALKRRKEDELEGLA